MATQNPTSPTGTLGQTLNFNVEVSTADGAQFNAEEVTTTTNAPGATSSITGSFVPSPTQANLYSATGTCTSPNVAGTYVVSVLVNGVDNQDVAVTWNIPPIEQAGFDSNGFTFTNPS